MIPRVFYDLRRHSENSKLVGLTSILDILVKSMCGSLKRGVVIVFCLTFQKIYKVFYPELLMKLSCPEL